MTRRLLSPALALIALSVTGCPAGPGAGTAGALGNGTFSYSCTDDGDSVCIDDNGSEVAHAMPSSIALNASFGASFTGTTSSGFATVVSASSLYIQTPDSDISAPTFKAVKLGLAALIAENDGLLVDFTHVRIQTTESIRVDSVASGDEISSQGISALTEAAGETREVRALPLSATGDALAGALDCQWTIADSTIASIEGAADNRVFVVGQKAGATTLHVSLGGHAQDIAVTVSGSAGSGGAGGGQ